MSILPEHLSTIALLAVLGALPVAMVMTTPFTKITIVLALLRNALGLQQVPSNLAITGIGLAATLLIMGPTLRDISDNLGLPGRLSEGAPPLRLTEVQAALQGPLQEFMLRHAGRQELEFMQGAVARMDPEALAETGDIQVLVPAFVISEVSSGIRIGLILYIVFVVIDLVTANILMALGMSMLAPNTISTPLKLLVLVMSDGLSRLMHGLILGYAP